MSEPLVRNDAEPRISPWGALLRVLTSPGETFRSLGRKPPVLAPYLIHSLVGIVAIALSYSALMDLAMEQAAAAMANQPQMTAEDMAMMQTVMRWSGGVALVVQEVAGPWVVGLVLALVATFFGQFQGGEVPLTSYMGMIGYARMPLDIARLLSAVFMAVTGKQLDLSAAALLPDGASPVLMGALQMINPFGIWYYALLAIGFAALFGREPRRGWAMPVTLFVLGVIVSAAAASIGAAFTMNVG